MKTATIINTVVKAQRQTAVAFAPMFNAPRVKHDNDTQPSSALLEIILKV